MNVLNGRCHCGNITFRFETKLPQIDLSLRQCSCDFCVKTGGVFTSDLNGVLSIDIPHDSEPYRFGHKTADFHICKECGCLPAVTCTIDGSLRGVINVRVIEGFELDSYRVRQSSFAHETAEERLARRANTWIPHVQVNAVASGAKSEHS